MSKHTEGPWVLFVHDAGGENSGYPISISTPDIDGDGKTIVRTGGFYPYEWDIKLSKSEVLANARLIAAAPELLEALEAICKHWNNENYVYYGIDDEHFPIMETAKQAIAKAKGEL